MMFPMNSSLIPVRLHLQGILTPSVRDIIFYQRFLQPIERYDKGYHSYFDTRISLLKITIMKRYVKKNQNRIVCDLFCCINLIMSSINCHLIQCNVITWSMQGKFQTCVAIWIHYTVSNLLIFWQDYFCINLLSILDYRNMDNPDTMS